MLPLLSLQGPIINWCVCRNKVKAGFTYPSYGAWVSALGPSSLRRLYACYEDRCGGASARCRSQTGASREVLCGNTGQAESSCIH